MSIIKFLHEHRDAVIIAIATTILGIIGTIIVAKWFAKRKPDKPESEKIGHKLKIKILQLGWKMKKILQQILGRRQTRAELLDLSQNIYNSLAAIRNILKLNSQSLQDLKEDINKPMTEEQKEAYYIAHNKLTKSLDMIKANWNTIESRGWKGMYKKDGKIRKRI